jgi:hypothetical protein
LQLFGKPDDVNADIDSLSKILGRQTFLP